jgi:hypothetical protein
MAEVETRKRGAHAKRAKVLYEKRPDGLLVPVVMKQPRRIPWAPLLFAGVCLIGLKGFIYAYFGADVLEVRVSGLSQGIWSDQVFAFLLQPDPLSTKAALWIEPLLPDTAFRATGR